MTIEEMQRRKQEMGYSYEQIAELSGLSVETVQKVLEGITRNPRYETRQALEKLFHRDTDWGIGPTPGLVRETSSYHVQKPEKKPGEYTLEDYYALPDDQRVELIDGVFYEMSSPRHVHQMIGGEIYQKFAAFIKEKKGLCVPAYAPLDVQLDCDDRTMVQPDVLILCDRSKFKGGVIYGAPDLVVEVLSKSTRKKDILLKTMKYENAGVREYWLVDPKKKTVLVYDFEHDLMPTIYGFDSVVPVRIFDGECQVDFAEIYEYVKFLYADDWE